MRITEVKRFAIHDGDGIRTTVFCKGCSLKCRWCHNPEAIDNAVQIGYYSHKCIGCGSCSELCEANTYIDNKHIFNRDKCILCGKCTEVCSRAAFEIYGREIDCDELVWQLMQDKEFYACTDGGITFSGGECLLQAEDCRYILKAVKEKGIHTAVDTCGHVPRQSIDLVMPYTDVFLYDFKHIDSKMHMEGTGADNKLIMENLVYLADNNKNIEIRIPLIPGYNDNYIPEMGRYLADIKGITKVKVLAYHNYAGAKYEALGIENTLPEMKRESGVRESIETLKELGLNAVI